MRKLAPSVAATNAQPILAWDVGEQSAYKPLASFGSASVRKIVAEERAKAEIEGVR